MGAIAGLCLGATQSASRTLVAVFSHQSKAAELFGFRGLFGKLAAIFGLLSLGLLQVRPGLQSAILLCALFFLVGLVLGLFVREQRGRAAALKRGHHLLPRYPPARARQEPRKPHFFLPDVSVHRVQRGNCRQVCSLTKRLSETRVSSPERARP